MDKNNIYYLIKYNECSRILKCDDCILEYLYKLHNKNKGRCLDKEFDIKIRDNAKYILNVMKFKFLEKYL